MTMTTEILASPTCRCSFPQMHIFLLNNSALVTLSPAGSDPVRHFVKLQPTPNQTGLNPWQLQNPPNVPPAELGPRDAVQLVTKRARGNVEDVRFHPMLHFCHFWALLAFDLPQCQEPWRQGELPGNEKQKKTQKTTQDKQKENNKERHWRDKQCSPCFLAKTRLMPVQVFKCSGVQSY